MDEYNPITVSLLMNPKRSDISWSSVSFACGGWLQFYLFGVARSLQHCKVDRGVIYAGCSAGALAATGIALGGDFDDAVQYCKDYCIPKAFSQISGLFNLDHYVKVCLERSANIHKWNELSPGQLQIAVTRLLPYLLKERATEFQSKEDLLTTLVASAAAFPFAPLVYRRGSWCVDGGLSDFQPIVDSHTVTVSPFYFSRADIKPSRYVPLWWALLPPNDPSTIDWIYNLGWEDGLSWLKEHGINTSIATQHPVRDPHPFDVPGKVSLHRFLGYNLDQYSKYVSYMGDAILFVLLLFVWKPFALLMVYLEVLVLLVFHFLKALFLELYDIAPMVLLILALLMPQLNFVIYSTLLILLHKILLFGPCKDNNYQQLWECVKVISSVALVVKLFKTGPSCKSEEPSTHNVAEKTSIFFRISKHFL